MGKILAVLRITPTLSPKCFAFFLGAGVRSVPHEQKDRILDIKIKIRYVFMLVIRFALQSALSQ